MPVVTKSTVDIIVQALLTSDDQQGDISIQGNTLVVSVWEAGVPVDYTFNKDTGELIDSFNPERDLRPYND